MIWFCGAGSIWIHWSNGATEDSLCYKYLPPPCLDVTKPAPMHAPQILVVDDDLEIRKLLARYLKEQGFYLCSTILKGLLTLNLNLCEII
jgi:hypothetical protein